ncbi:MFS transporter [Streptomyces sp. NPDC059255]|uniref:MFS transporter n=1 Tax=Streptomyces sp. NPDC059255 TaxID=3346793 RepID=UPI00369BDDCD
MLHDPATEVSRRADPTAAVTGPHRSLQLNRSDISVTPPPRVHVSQPRALPTHALDIPGTVTGTGGLLTLVYGITRGGENGWTDSLTLTSFFSAAVLLLDFLIVQRRAAHPMMPLHLFSNRTRSGSYTILLFVGAGMIAFFYFLTLYMRLILGCSAIKSGFAYLPFSIGMGIAVGVSSKLVTHVASRVVAAPGLLVAAAGMFWFTRLAPDSSYPAHLMPAMFVTALGLGVSFVPMALGAVHAVAHQETGIASALLNTAQQFGGVLGLANLSPLSTNAADDRLPNAAATFYQGLATRNQTLIAKAGDALTHGYTIAFAATAVIFIRH